jgi:hypothetical protein
MKQISIMISLALMLLFITGIAGCDKVKVTDSGELTDWRFDYSDFTKLEVDHGFIIDVIHGDTYSINITVDRAVFEYLVVEQHGQNLRVGLENGPVYIDTSQSAVITMPELEHLQLSSGSMATLSGFETNSSISFELSGSSELEIPSYTADDVAFSLSDNSSVNGLVLMNNGEFKLSNASVIDLAGSAAEMTLQGSGNSRFLMDDFPVETADIKLSSSNASINVSTLLMFDLSDRSHLDYMGDPMVKDIKVSGDSTVN